MECGACVERLRHILRFRQTERVSYRTHIVDFPNPAVQTEVIDLCPRDVEVICVSDICKHDMLFSADVLYRLLDRQIKPMVLRELSSFLRFYGKETLLQILSSVLDYTPRAPLVVFTYQCRELLESLINERNRSLFLFVEGTRAPIPALKLFNTECAISDEMDIYDGIQSVPCRIESALAIGESDSWLKLGAFLQKPICIRTQITERDIPNCMFRCSWVHDDFSLLCYLDPIILKLHLSWGSSEEWRQLLCGVLENKSSQKYIEAVFKKSVDMLQLCIYHYAKYDSYKKWLLTIALKLWTPSNEYLHFCVEKFDFSPNSNLIRSIYREIVSVSPENVNFARWNEERYGYLSLCKDDIQAESNDFCKWIGFKGSSAIDYLPCVTNAENEKLLLFLSKYEANKTQNELIAKLGGLRSKVYYYLKPYTHYCAKGVLRDELVHYSDYMEKYKTYLLTNQVPTSFLDIVEEEALNKRSYSKFPSREEEVELICKKAKSEKSAVYLVDALGSEFLSFIEEEANQRKLAMKATITRASIPTITCVNYDSLRKRLAEAGFLEGKNVFDIKDIDACKHDCIKNECFEKTDLPVHLLKELECIQKLFDQIDNQLKHEDIGCAYIVPDHGASRLAVLYNKSIEAIKTDMKTEHSGRVAIFDSKSDIPKDAIVGEDHKYCVMAGYRCFSGASRKGVEFHGGATLEEILIPVIEIRNPNASYSFVVTDKVIYVDSDRPAVIRFYSPRRMENISIKIIDGLCNNAVYPAITDDGNEFVVKTKIYKAGKFKFDIYQDDRIVGSHNEVTIESRGIANNAETDAFFENEL